MMLRQRTCNSLSRVHHVRPLTAANNHNNIHACAFTTTTRASSFFAASSSSSSWERTTSNRAAVAAAAAAGTTLVWYLAQDHNGSGAVHCTATIYELSEIDAQAEQPLRFPRRKAYEQTKRLAEKDDEDANILWRHARAAYQLTKEPDVSKDEKKELLEEALKACKQAVRQDPNDHNSRRWYGTVLQAYSGFQGYKQQIADAYEVKSQWEQAVEINPDDASAHYLLGRWCFTVTEMAWYQRAFAKTLFAEPPSSSYQEARDYFSGAERISPNFWKANQYFLAETEHKLGNADEAIHWLKSAIRLPIKSRDDEEFQEKALELLKKLDKSGEEYSRALQFDKDKKKQQKLLEESEELENQANQEAEDAIR